MSLSVSRLVRVVINLSPLAAARRSFGVLCIAGDSDVISGAERLRTYTGIDGVAADFGTDAPEYNAAVLYFGQSPKPATLMIGRWIRTATSGFNLGEILTSSQQSISNWNVITNGGFVIVVDGVTKTLSGLDFSSATNLNGVATIINAALTGAEVSWNGSEFTVTSDSTGAGTAASGTITLDTNPSPGARASGTITFSGNPSNGDTVTINGTVVTFVTGSPSGNQVQIGGSQAATVLALQAFLEASADTGLAACTYSSINPVTTVTARAYSTAGNAFTLAESSAVLAVSGATLSGGVNPDTLTVNGTLLTFVAASPDSDEILVGPTVAATSANLQGVLQASLDSNISEATYATASLVTTATFKDLGVAGNSFTLAKSSTHITLSGATLSGGVVASTVSYATAGSGTDISEMLGLTSDTSIALVSGYDAETPVECAAILANMSSAWFGLMFQASVQPTVDQNLDVSAFIEAADPTRIYGVTITDTSVLSSLVTNDLASQLKALNYRQSFVQYSENAYAVASMFGRAFSVNFNGNKTTITLMYKQEPGVAPLNLTETQAQTLKAKRCNVFVAYNNDTSIIQYGMMSGQAWFDEIHGLDWLQNAIQTNCYNLLYTSSTKIPQTDSGVNQIIGSIAQALEQAVANGLSAPGVWNQDGFGDLNRGDYLQSGYYIYAQPIALQSQSDREARIAPPIQVAVKLAGAIQEIDVVINVNR